MTCNATANPTMAQLQSDLKGPSRHDQTRGSNDLFTTRATIYKPAMRSVNKQYTRTCGDHDIY